jgi:hypothetical protein
MDIPGRDEFSTKALQHTRSGTMARSSPFRGSRPTANGVSSRPFFLSLLAPAASKSWGGWQSACAFFGRRRKAVRTSLGLPTGAENAINPAPDALTCRPVFETPVAFLLPETPYPLRLLATIASCLEKSRISRPMLE